MSGAAFLWTLFTSIHHSGKLSRKEPPTSGRARDISAIGSVKFSRAGPEIEMFEQMAGFWVLWQVTTPHADLWSEKGSSCLGCFQPWKRHGCLKHGLFPISFPRRILIWDAGRGHLNNDCDPFQKFDEGLRNVNASALHIGLTVLDQMVDIRLSWIFLVSNGISSRSVC